MAKSALPSAHELSVRRGDALQAIKARIEGDYDHPVLVAFGPLADTVDGVYNLATQGLVVPQKIPGTDENWENGALGRDERYVEVASPAEFAVREGLARARANRT